ncbi:hypothetical protein PV729_19360 [Streptomyces europaeiscabiei]|uniref:Uncharacterized protein n=1 Tax=Streptomyces europaeiscabiei TaxID=146819 RepID=A0ABU4NHE1_9ACTN|nr:hypothetical protein [Streptomyces europaeiscabiei]MDX2762993.1 hypothetical protein [Streptomyces europaeiscabiei]MDX3544555.1 hypothetical protein [Streptomyces europaeiscabiei]MDX3553904.1 hypothetical protein [Streptomyces europaeiscabiei]MDX3702022.1 hypothetical protein [Streptomyces europaeiscabiei]MDX3833946.1 hypothetical protein [Streptomyces europaeiscabiei]
MATVRRSLPTAQAHPLFRGVFDDWLTKADALSALPNAPVVPDTPVVPHAPDAFRRLRLPTWRRLRSRFGRYAVAEAHVGPP